MPRKTYSVAVISLLGLLLAALAVLGGPLNQFDRAAIAWGANARLASPMVTQAAIWVTIAGSAPVTVPLAMLGSAYLACRDRLVHAAAFLAIVLGGRVMVELLKQSIGRARPELDLHAVQVQSLSFPSGHAANSMITFVAIALFCAPLRHRVGALTIAIAASLAVGATRPLLGVHWPSDVLAGWIFGLAWAVGWWRILGGSSRDGGTAGAASPLFGQRRQDMPTPRDPAEQALIEDAESIPTRSHSGGTGGDMARNVGSRDELARGTGKDSGVTRVHKSDKPDDGDEPNLPNR